MLALGIDIGTTSICAAVVDGETGAVLRAENIDNGAFLKTENPWEKIQDPKIILERAEALAGSLISEHAPAAIGFSGQMHGILYLDGEGEPVSPLYIWQDGRGDLPYKDKKSYAGYLAGLTGYSLATGYGAVTHFYNHVNGLVPPNAKVFCTIHALAAMRLAGQKRPVVHVSDAASLGLFDLERGEFDRVAAEKAGLDFSMFPQVCAGCEILGRTKEGIPVCAAVGDNQASFSGSVAEPENSVLVNIGTGSQISMAAKGPASSPAMEARPLDRGDFLLVGSSLCGGRAYALLEEFFRSAARAAGFETESMYPVMDRLSEDFERLENPVEFKTLFCGTRENPGARASISNLGEDNFTPAHFTAGVLRGIVDELYEKYAASGHSGAKTLVASGNGVRKSPVMRKMLEKRFGMTVKIPAHREEAAYGAALFAMAAAGLCESFARARSIIKYL